MKQRIRIALGQYSAPGPKDINQDCCGSRVPTGTALALKGAAFAVADGISSSPVSHIASATAVGSFIEDYFCTSEAWSVQHAATRVLKSINSWLYAEGRRSPYRHEPDKTYVCTFSALIFKAQNVHVLHVGDSRVYRLRDHALEQLTIVHRQVVAQHESYLSRALGAAGNIDIDYQSIPLLPGDIFLITTDGVHEYANPQFVIETIDRLRDNLDQAAHNIVQHALEAGSRDNLTLQIVRVDALVSRKMPLLQEQAEALPFAPALEANTELDGYRIIRPLHISARSHCFLAQDNESATKVVLKVPATEQRKDPTYLERFLLEEWIARRINNAHVVKAPQRQRERHFLYTVTDYVEGQTLAQWLLDHPSPDLATVRNFVEQIARGLQAFHRMDMLHQDIKPDNLMIDRDGTIRIIDFGSSRVAGIEESDCGQLQPHLLGTALYAAPEYFLGEAGSIQSDIYSLGVLTYHLLSGSFPYGTKVAKTRTAVAQQRLRYQSLLNDEREIPVWIDAAVKKAVHPNPLKRHQELSEFLQDLRKPNPEFLSLTRAPLIERNPVLVWQGLCFILLLIVIYQAAG